MPVSGAEQANLTGTITSASSPCIPEAPRSSQHQQPSRERQNQMACPSRGSGLRARMWPLPHPARVTARGRCRHRIADADVPRAAPSDGPPGARSVPAPRQLSSSRCYSALEHEEQHNVPRNAL